MSLEREILFTGVGGQGVQLAAQVLARAAMLEGRHVMLLGTYGGTMRGGNTDATLVVADAPISSPPIVSRAWALLAMHHQFFAPLRGKLRPGSLVVANSTVFTASLDRTWRAFEVPATARATELGSPVVGAMVLIGAFARITGLVSLASLEEAMRACVPSYRRQHVELNERALHAGFEHAPADAAPAWRTEEAA
ncbi:MAG TPA: 2-oxoacid:acceptor oxidoreductase family protein [Myxococcota bacterium]|nr:2-oxoacid:acceptor oxidoreductase family protein [Myxococcota bacterium]